MARRRFNTEHLGVRHAGRLNELVQENRRLKMLAATTRRPAAGAPVGPPPLREGAPVTLNNVEFHPARRLVRTPDLSVTLTRLEFRLLYLLASHPGVVFSRPHLLSKVWGADVNVTARSVDTLVKRLRQKIERDTSSPAVVRTVRGHGYTFPEAPAPTVDDPPSGSTSDEQSSGS